MSDKTPSTPIQTPKDYEMTLHISTPTTRPRTPAQFHMSNRPTTQTPNRFQVFEDFPALSYIQAAQTPSAKLQSTPNPSANVNIASSSSSSPSPYFSKPTTKFLTLTRYKEFPDLQTLKQLPQRLFPEGCHWCPDDPTKNQRYYEFILVDSGSVTITHNNDRKDSTKIGYSKCIIKKVCLPDEWGSSPYLRKSFSVRYIPDGYSYYDYRMAWFRAFLYRPFDHSWFFSFHTACPEKIPIWFYHWWLLMGPQSEIYPPIALMGFKNFLNKSKGEAYERPLLFHLLFRVPWIFCWTYQLIQSLPKPLPLSLVQEFKIKWWAGFDEQQCSQELIDHFIKTGERTKKIIQSVSKNIPLVTPAQVTSKPNIFEVLEQNPDLAQELLSFLKSKSQDSNSSDGSSSDPFGGPMAQDPNLI